MTAEEFVTYVAGYSIWDYDKDDGTPYQECAEPDDGYEDSHMALMNIIEAARKIKG
jgi:hypothetical protein